MEAIRIKQRIESESWRETVAILSDRDLMAEIREGLSESEKNSRLYSVEELLKF